MSNSRFVLVGLMFLALFALMAQMVIDFSVLNIGSACIVFASSMAVLLYLMWTPAMQTHPLSTFAIFGFCVTNQLGALLGQTAAWTPLALNLHLPLETFGMLATFQVLALLAHAGYRLLLSPPRDSAGSLLRQGLAQLGLYTPPSAGALWIMGIVGLFTFLLGKGGDGTASKVMQGISFLTWAPFLIPMYLLQNGAGYCNPRRQYPFLALFSSVIVLLGLAANARGVMLAGFMTIGLFALLMVLRNNNPVSPGRVARLGLLGLVLAALAIPLSDLATAMVVARKARGNISAVQMVKETLHYVQRPEELEARREKDRSATAGMYDETYFANPLVARLVETKFQDNALYFASRLNAKDTELLATTTVDMFWATLPDPVLKVLRIDIDKKSLEFSMGDYLSYLAQGDRAVLGSRRTGSMLPQGLAIGGIGFVGAYLVFCWLVFAVLDLLSFRGPSGQVLLSAVGMLGVWKMFQYGLSSESLQAWVGLIGRTVPQNIVLFLIFATLARFGATVLGRLYGAQRIPQVLATR